MDSFFLDFVKNGSAFVIIGMIINVALGGIGSAKGLRTAATQATGIMAEKPQMFGKMLVLVVLPGTQGFYSFIASFLAGLKLVASGTSSFGSAIALMCLLIGMGIVEYISALEQGRTSAAAINMVAKQEGTSGQAIIFPALVETYAVLALLITIITMLWIK